jgi:hypothetical protein
MTSAAVGRWNRLLGWALLVAGFVWAAWLDPWSLSEHDPAHIVGSPRMVARHGQAVVLAMAFLQLLTAELLAAAGQAAHRVAAAFTGLGAILYAAGYVLEPWQAGLVWMVPVGAALNAAGFAVLLASVANRPAQAWTRVILPVLCLGMLLDGVLGLSRADPAFLPLTFLGREDGVRLRMLRLGRVAVTALSVTAFLYQGLMDRAGPVRGPTRFGQIALWVGVIGMPAILAAAAFLRPEIKYLLPIPALATFAGVCVGVALAARHARPLEVWGWLLTAASMGVGLLMGLYAFDGPLPDPAFLGTYNDWPRRLNRLGHAYCILFGLLSIFIARAAPAGRRAIGGWMVAVGGAATLLVIVLVGVGVLPPAAMAAGPLMVAASVLLCLAGAASLSPLSPEAGERGGRRSSPLSAEAGAEGRERKTS